MRKRLEPLSLGTGSSSSRGKSPYDLDSHGGIRAAVSDLRGRLDKFDSDVNWRKVYAEAIIDFVTK